MISTVILTKNEEKTLAACIESVSFSSEVLVIDNDSTDKTIEIAKQRGAHVIEMSETGDFSELRNRGLTEAKNRGAKIIAITSGGKLSEITDTIIRVPTGLQPRNAVGYLFFPMVGVLYNSGILDVKNSDMNEMVKVLSDSAYFDEKGNEIAKKIRDKTPIIYSSSFFGPCAYRFKCEINENSKHPAYHHVFPELCHNELVGYKGMEKSRFIVILMKSNSDHERIRKRMDICKEIFGERLEVEEITALGTSIYSKIFSLIYLGDWVSYHLALLNRIDPTPVEVIEDLKRKLVE